MRIDPERDIWSLGVMVQGSGQMGELSGRRRRRRRHLEIQVDIQARKLYLEFFHVVLGSWREIFENGNWGSTQNFDANLMSIMVWPTEQLFENCEIVHVFKGSDTFPGTMLQK